MIRPNSLQAQYLPKVRWSEPTPVMVQTLMLRSIEATQGIRYVARRPLGARGDYAIVTEVIDFQAELDEDGQTTTVELRLISRIVREEDVRIVASKTFSATATTSSSETESVIEAFDIAAGRLFPDFSNWVVSKLKAQ
jgi:cholesterol transport system auxiliary component